MRVETGLVDRKGQEICKLPGEKNKKPKKNRKRNKKSMANVVQKLFETCKQVFAPGGAGFVPSPDDIERLRSVLDSMKPEDVGLSEDMPYFRTSDCEGTPPITYLHLYECDKFSRNQWLFGGWFGVVNDGPTMEPTKYKGSVDIGVMGNAFWNLGVASFICQIGIFCLPQSGVIPLHNHPGMTVFSKLLFGSMHIKSYDWATDVSHNTKEDLNPSHFKPSGIRLAKIKNDSVFTVPCDTSILYPAAGGNMHCFTAVTSFAVLDVLGPPYSDAEGRHCTYYTDFPYASFSGDAGLVPEDDREGYAWLEEIEKPEDCVVVGAMYRGPEIVEN